MRMQITFRGGGQIEVDAESFKTTRHPITNQLTHVGWTTPAGWTRKLHTLEISEVVAIVAIDDDTSDAPEAALSTTPGNVCYQCGTQLREDLTCADHGGPQ